MSRQMDMNMDDSQIDETIKVIHFGGCHCGKVK